MEYRKEKENNKENCTSAPFFPGRPTLSTRSPPPHFAWPINARVPKLRMWSDLPLWQVGPTFLPSHSIFPHISLHATQRPLF